MDQTALSNLHPFLRTKEDVNHLVEVIRDVLEELYKEPFNIKASLTKVTRYDLAEAIEKSIPDPANKPSLQHFLTELQQEVLDLPTVHIILPFPPKDQLVEVIHDWFYTNYKRTVVLDISVDPVLIGGSVISFKGKANDYSLKSQIDQLKISG